MFTCRDCHEDADFCSMFCLPSHGACEWCGTVTTCADCRCPVKPKAKDCSPPAAIRPSSLPASTKISYVCTPAGSPARRVHAVVKWSGEGNPYGLGVPATRGAIFTHDKSDWLVLDSEATVRSVKLLVEPPLLTKAIELLKKVACGFAVRSDVEEFICAQRSEITKALNSTDARDARCAYFEDHGTTCRCFTDSTPQEQA